MTRFDALLRQLARHEVAFIVVGGAAAIAHGSSRLTQDLDIVYDRSEPNLDRLVAALADHRPYLRRNVSAPGWRSNRTAVVQRHVLVPEPAPVDASQASVRQAKGPGSACRTGSDRRRTPELTLYSNRCD